VEGVKRPACMALGQQTYEHVSGHGESAPDIILGPDGMLLSGVIGTRVVSPDLFNTLYCNMLNPGTWLHSPQFYQNSLCAWVIHMHPKAVAGVKILTMEGAETKCPFSFCTATIDNQGVESNGNFTDQGVDQSTKAELAKSAVWPGTPRETDGDRASGDAKIKDIAKRMFDSSSDEEPPATDEDPPSSRSAF